MISRGDAIDWYAESLSVVSHQSRIERRKANDIRAQSLQFLVDARERGKHFVQVPGVKRSDRLGGVLLDTT
jgi:hypothetical protein